MEVKVSGYDKKYKDDITTIIHNFYEESLKEYEPALKPDVISQTIEQAQKDAVFLLIINGKCEGIIYGAVTTSPINQRTTYQEIIWYVNEEYRRYGKLLLDKTQEHLKKNNINSMIMVAMENSMSSRLKAFYERLGFQPMETHYIKEL